MRKSGFSGVCGLIMLLAGVAGADTPVYDEETRTLTVPVVEVDGQPGRFQDVVLEPDGNGGWIVASMEEGMLLDSKYVESYGMSSTGDPVVRRQVNLTGTFPDGCLHIGRVTQRLTGDTIELHIYYGGVEWLRQGRACTLGTEPFGLSIPLDTRGLDAGDYHVRVNGAHRFTFTVEESELFQAFTPFGSHSACKLEPQPVEGVAWVPYRC